jgi:zona occludens toxin
MITLFTGMPGAGKTASMVDFLSKLPGDRPIFSDGLKGLKLSHTPCDSNNWHTELPDGAILVIDEVQRVWRPRGSGAKVPDSVAALETHRHRGIDIFITTQSPRLMDANVRGLVGRHVHIRDTGILGRYWYEWPECNDSMSWKTCVNKKRISLPKKSFDLYTSASIHTTPVRGVPRSLIVGAVALIFFAVAAFGVYKIISKTQAPEPVAVVVPDKAAAPTSADGQPLPPEPPPYDPTEFIPRASSKPESAPAYDHLRVVVAMPVIAGGVCMGNKCKCLTQQGTDTGLGSDECRTWLDHRPFNPYAHSQASPGAPPPANMATPPAMTTPTGQPETRPVSDLSSGFSATHQQLRTPLY